MLSKKTRKWICILISIGIILSGMCFDYHKTDSFFSCADSDFASSMISSSDSSCLSDRNKDSNLLNTYLQDARRGIFLKDICTSRLMGRYHKFGCRLENSSKTLRLSILRTFFLCISLAGFLYFQLFWKRKAGLPGKAHTYSNFCTIQYIHEQDGKKEHPTFFIRR